MSEIEYSDDLERYEATRPAGKIHHKRSEVAKVNNYSPFWPSFMNLVSQGSYSIHH